MSNKYIRIQLSVYNYFKIDAHVNSCGTYDFNCPSDINAYMNSYATYEFNCPYAYIRYERIYEFIYCILRSMKVL